MIGCFVSSCFFSLLYRFFQRGEKRAARRSNLNFALFVTGLIIGISLELPFGIGSEDGGPSKFLLQAFPYVVRKVAC